MRFAAVLALILAVFPGFAAAQSPPAASGLALEAPECVSSKNGRLDCLARDTSGSFVWTYHDGRKWSRPQILLGRFAARASCVVRGPFGLNCFAIRADGSLWHIAMNGGRWRRWQPLGGRLAIGRPSCVAPARNQIVCHARARSGALAVKAWLGDASWQEWREVAGRIDGDPSCVRLRFERVACFWRRDDGLFAGLLPAESGPGAAVLTLPRPSARPTCASLGGDRAVCLSVPATGQVMEWRGQAVLGGAGVDGASLRSAPASLHSPNCLARSGRVLCTTVSASGDLNAIEVMSQGWTEPAAVAAQAVGGSCFVFEAGRIACPYVTRTGDLRAVFRQDLGPGSMGAALAALPSIVEKPALPSPLPPSPLPATGSAPVAITPVSIGEPLGVWHVFEPRSGLHCQLTLFDAPARPHRSLTRDADCDAMPSLRGVSRWSGGAGGIFLRDARGRVYFRFVEAGPTALRAKWRRNDFIMMARDLRAFAGPPLVSAPVDKPDVAVPAPGAARGVVGVWRLRAPGRRTCLVRLTLNPDTAQTQAIPEGCPGSLARIDGWSVRRGALVLERDGAPFARFVEGRGVTWRARGGLTMVRQ